MTEMEEHWREPSGNHELKEVLESIEYLMMVQEQVCLLTCSLLRPSCYRGSLVMSHPMQY